MRFRHASDIWACSIHASQGNRECEPVAWRILGSHNGRDYTVLHEVTPGSKTSLTILSLEDRTSSRIHTCDFFPPPVSASELYDLWIFLTSLQPPMISILFDMATCTMAIA